MRLLRRNTRKFEYLPYTGLETDLNEAGEHTGDFHPEYGDPVEYRGNISTPSGQTQQQFYGADIRYTHTLVMDDPEVDIKENGMIRWKGNLYDILAVRPSLNAVSIALRRRTDDSTAATPGEGEGSVDGGDTPTTPEDPETPEEPIEGETGQGEGEGENPSSEPTGETGTTGEEPVAPEPEGEEP